MSISNPPSPSSHTRRNILLGCGAVLLVIACCAAVIAVTGMQWDLVRDFLGNLSGVEKVSKIAFTSYQNNNADIYVINSDGTGLAQLTNNPTADENAAWSPDGDKIAFVSDRDGNREIYVMNSDGSNQTRLTFDLAEDSDPAWSPDGERIVFASKRVENWEIYVMNADGANLIRWTYTDDITEKDPCWLEDGSRIVFSGGSGQAVNIYVMDEGGSSGTQITNSVDRIFWFPACSPIDDSLAFESNQNGADFFDFDIYTMNSDGTNVVRLTATIFNESAPAWSADGRRIAFVTNRDGDFEIYIMNRDGTNLIRLTNSTGEDGSPAWQP